MSITQQYFAWWPQVTENFEELLESQKREQEEKINTKKINTEKKLFWTFIPPDIEKKPNKPKELENNNEGQNWNEWTNENEWNEKSDFWTENIAYPILERFKDNEKITEDQFDEILKNLNEWKDIKESLNVIDDTNIQWEISNLVENINDSNLENNKKAFLENFSENNWQKIDLDKDDSLKIIAENYTKIPNPKWEFNKNADFSTAVKLAAMKILKNSPNIDKNTEDYKKAIERINSWDHRNEYKWIKFLLKEWWSENWKKVLKSEEWKKIWKNERKNKQTLSERFEKIHQSYTKAKEENNIDLLTEILEQAKELKEEEPKNWEVFPASKLDTMIKEIQDIIWEN